MRNKLMRYQLFFYICFMQRMHIVPSKIKYLAPKQVAWARMQLFSIWGIKAPRRQINPASQPLSLHRSELLGIVGAKQEYVASLKADGVRYLLLLTTEIVDGVTEYVALMFDRKLTPYEVSLWAPAHMFEMGSLFDGELVCSAPDQFRYLVFDTMTVAGDRIGQTRNYIERFNVICKLFDIGVAYESLNSHLADELVLHHSHIVVFGHDCDLRLQSKPIVTLDNLRNLWYKRQLAGFRQDGVIFTNIKSPVTVGRNHTQYKWKFNHTIDVMVKFDNGSSAVYVEHGARRILLSSEPVLAHPMQAGGRLRCKLVDNLILQNLVKGSKTYIIECSMDLKGDTLMLFPAGIREDKSVPNQLTTVESTIENVVEQIDVESLLDEVCTAF
jgi:hypothetical protein